MAVLAAAPGLAQVPARPDFSGTWVFDTAGSHANLRVNRLGPGASVPRSAITEPTKLVNVPPIYPSDAKNARVGGTVILEAVIDRAGYVADLKVIRSVPTFDQSALDAVSRWRYTPTLLDGKPVEVIMTVAVNYVLGGGRVGKTTQAPPSPTDAFGTGMGHGYVPTELTIRQDATKLTVARQIATGSDKLTYALDQKPIRNRLPKAGIAVDDTYTYTSRWDGAKLVTEITWMGPNGLRELTETMERDGDALTVTTTRRDPTTGADAFSETMVYKKQQ